MFAGSFWNLRNTCFWTYRIFAISAISLSVPRRQFKIMDGVFDHHTEYKDMNNARLNCKLWTTSVGLTSCRPTCLRRNLALFFFLQDAIVSYESLNISSAWRILKNLWWSKYEMLRQSLLSCFCSSVFVIVMSCQTFQYVFSQNSQQVRLKYHFFPQF